MAFDCLVPFIGQNNVKGWIAPISSQSKETNQTISLRRTKNAAENEKKHGQHWTYVLTNSLRIG